MNEVVKSSEIERYANMINTYGPVTVILAVFIIVLLISFAIILKIMHNSNKQIMDQQKQMLDQLLKNEEILTTPKKEKNLVEIFIRLNEAIKSILKSIRYDIGTDRISVYVFHNGVYSSHGLPFFKASCVCEVFAKRCGITKKIDEHIGMNLTMFDTSISKLYECSSLLISDLDEVAEKYPVLYNIFHKENIKSAIGVAIYDNDNNMLGVLIGEFTNEKTHEELIEINSKLTNYTNQLSPILEYSGYQSLN